jgi:MoxR-like ATPase
MEENTSTLDIRAIKNRERECFYRPWLWKWIKWFGQKHMIERLLIGLQGTYFIRRCSGISKTLAINTLSQAVYGSFSNLPDLFLQMLWEPWFTILNKMNSPLKRTYFCQLCLTMRLTVRQPKCNQHCDAGEASNNWRYYFQVRKTFLSLGYSEPYRTRGTYQLPKRKSIVLCWKRLSII